MASDDKKIQPEPSKPSDEGTPSTRRRRFTRRGAARTAFVILVLGVLVSLLSVLLYRNQVFDPYVKSQFVAKMSDIGIEFDAEVFRVTVNPLALELKNATFNDKLTGEKLFFIRDAQLAMTIKDLYSWQLSRDILIDTTEINGAEVWVRFDESGRSNFSNLRLVEDEEGSRVNFRYESARVSIQDSVVHFGDLSRKISADAKNVVFSLEPEDLTVADEQKRYKFDLTSTDSNFVYDEKTVGNIDIRALGVVHRNGGEITEFKLTTPIGESTLVGTLTDWASPKYDFQIRSTVDLTQAAMLMPNGTAMTGMANFNGRVTGEGETYKIVGEADSQSLRAAGVYLQAVNVNATLSGVNDSYDANGTAIARMLTFDDFRVDFLKLVGNVRGTGTDFRWLGDLQAAAASSKSLSLGGLFLRDSFAEYKDRQLRAEAANGRTSSLKIKNNEFRDLAASDLKFSRADGTTRLTSPSAQARSFTTKDYMLNGISGRNVRVTDKGERTDVDVDGLRSQSAEVKGSRLKNLSADKFRFTDLPTSNEVFADNLRADQLDADGTSIFGLETPRVELRDNKAETIIYADKLRVAKISTDAANLGSLNIGGVRLAIRQGRVEGRSDDIDAGNVALNKTSTLQQGGNLENVKIARPVFIVEPSGRYRVTADLSLGGGSLGSVSLGAATTKVVVDNDRVGLNDVTAEVMDGKLNGAAVIALNNRTQSQIKGDFTNLDISKLLALQTGRVIPVDGETTGRVDLTFAGTNFRNASGVLNADIAANAGSAEDGLIPIDGKVNLSATDGLFTIDVANLKSANSNLNATGRFDLKDENSDLTLALRSTDASEIDRLVRVLGVSPEFAKQMDEMQVQIAGDLAFDGKVTGNFSDPNVNGRATLASISLRGKEIGSISTDISVTPSGTQLANGRLQQRDGGSAVFTADIPTGGVNNVAISATLANINAGSLLAALPIELPARIRDLDGRTSGTVDIRGLPNNALGAIDLAAATGVIAGQSFDNLAVKAVFAGTRIDLERADMSVGAGRLSVKGNYDRVSEAFNFDMTGNAVPIPLALALLPPNDAIPPITGDMDFTAKAVGVASQATTYDVNFNGTARGVNVGDNALGDVTFNGVTQGQVLTANLTATLGGRPQVINASVNFGSSDMPLTASTDFDQSPLAPFLAFVPLLKDYPITGTGSGRVEFGGNLQTTDASGKRVFTADNLSGTARFSQLALLIQDTPLAASEPVVIRFNKREVFFEKARFSGGGSNMAISGTRALTDDAVNDLSIDGRVNLTLLNLFSKDTFFAGLADTSVRMSGPNATARLSGTADVINGSVASFLGTDRFTADRIKARLIFTTDQVEVEEATGYLGGGKFTANGGGTLDGLSVQAFRFGLVGDNVTVPLPKDFVTTGDAKLEVSAQRAGANLPLQMTISGRVLARRSVYSKDIDLANLLTSRRDPVLSGTTGTTLPPRFDLVIEGRDALVVRNNIADLTASVSLALSGDASNPRLAGRITANSGTILFRKDRYIVQRGVLEFPPDTAIDPVLQLQAETEIAGYQVFVNYNGPLKESELATLTVRSSPALPQADVVSLITTGSLTNTAGGLPTFAQTGISTAAEVLTDSIINTPARKATDKLFGLNVFEIDPIISGQQVNASARLTVGRQINNNLRVTYSTNLSQDQNQVLAFEYRVSNRLSFVAQYENRALTNVTRNRDNFSFEVRFRKRF
ncbi:MAG: translocation/assembly module TamB domain-containing protein [Pyrinomonadaceae bacterium]